jgi:predicted dithiol-disulfide oxidoreductase (DUF899 family)
MPARSDAATIVEMLCGGDRRSIGRSDEVAALVSRQPELFAPPEPGQDPRHADSIDPFWNFFDFTPEGRPSDWSPKLAYEAPLTPLVRR